MPFSLLCARDIEIIHYYGLTTVRYSGLWDYVINGLTGKEYIKSRVINTYSAVAQNIFNRRRLVMLQRMDLLRVLIERSIRDAGASVNSMDLMTELYSLKWVLHPEGDDQEYKLRLYLESLVSSGDLIRGGSDFVVAGHAI